MTENTTITLTLTAQEAIAVANIIGQLPTQSNAYPLFMKVKGQIESQMQVEQQTSENA